MRIEMDGVEIEMRRERGARMGMVWCVRGIVAFPSKKVISGLSRKYLEGKLEKWDLPLDGHSVYVQLQPGTTREQRATFLVAVLVHCKTK